MAPFRPILGGRPTAHRQRIVEDRKGPVDLSVRRRHRGHDPEHILAPRSGATQLQDEVRHDVGEIIEYARARLAHYQCPTSVDFADALPRNPSGKLLKRQLREPYRKGHERRIH